MEDEMVNRTSMLRAAKRVLLATTLIFVSITMGGALVGCGGAGGQTVALPENMTATQEQALDSAKLLLDSMPFSYDNLVEWLEENDGFSTEDATFAADYCGADWRDQARKMAIRYLNSRPFSQSALLDQLKYEKFSEEDAKHGIENCGANWNEEAAKWAQQCLERDDYTHEELVDRLVIEGYTPEQAEYGVSQQGI